MAKISFDTDEVLVECEVSADFEFSAVQALSCVLDEMQALRKVMRQGFIRVQIEKKGKE